MPVGDRARVAQRGRLQLIRRERSGRACGPRRRRAGALTWDPHLPFTGADDEGRLFGNGRAALLLARIACMTTSDKPTRSRQNSRCAALALPGNEPGPVSQCLSISLAEPHHVIQVAFERDGLPWVTLQHPVQRLRRLQRRSEPPIGGVGDLEQVAREARNTTSAMAGRSASWTHECTIRPEPCSTYAPPAAGAPHLRATVTGGAATQKRPPDRPTQRRRARHVSCRPLPRPGR
jgi:hypothetical protein